MIGGWPTSRRTPSAPTSVRGISGAPKVKPKPIVADEPVEYRRPVKRTIAPKPKPERGPVRQCSRCPRAATGEVDGWPVCDVCIAPPRQRPLVTASTVLEFHPSGLVSKPEHEFEGKL